MMLEASTERMRNFLGTSADLTSITKIIITGTERNDGALDLWNSFCSIMRDVFIH